MSHYPYESRNRKEYAKLREGRDYAIWYKSGIDLQEIMSHLPKPLVEIGGPTHDGFYFLDGLELLSEVVITNISDNPLPYSPDAAEIAKHVSKVMDAREMPYEEGSIGAFFMSGMSMTSDWYMALPDIERDKHANEIESQMDIARLELEQAALGVLKPQEVRYAQRVPIFLEVASTLAKGGLFFTDGGLAEITILKNLGFELLACTQEYIGPEQNADSILYEFVVQK